MTSNTALIEALITTAAQIRNNELDEDQIAALDSDEGMIIDGCAVWFEAGTNNTRLWGFSNGDEAAINI